MIRGIGIDLVEIERIKAVYTRKGERFVNRVLTSREQEMWAGLMHDYRKLEFLAGRFAAKEAFSKAVGTGLGKLSFQHIEILHDEKGAPMMVVDGYQAEKVFLSISHSKHYCVAQVVVEA